MFELTLGALEKLINTYLSLDPEILPRLAIYQGKTAKIKLSDLNVDLYIQVNSRGFHVSKHPHEAPLTSIEGSCLDLCKMVSARNSPTKLISSGIKLSGDLDFGQSLYKILSEIDIDWEEYLSKLIGDTLAYQVMQQARGAFSWVKKSLTSLRENTQEYIQEEIRLSPSTTEIEDFYQEIAVLRDDTERLEQKIMLQLARKKNV